MRVITITWAWLVFPGVASAHIALVQPPARYSRDFQKEGPCGQAGGTPGDTVAEYAPGETITLRWDEFIAHPGHFRVALAVEGDAALVDPAGYDDLYVADNVLVDDIDNPDGGGEQTIEVELPDVTCERCTLQLIQVMTDKMPWGDAGGNDLYYQCADIRIGADVVPGAGGTAADQDAGGDEGGCSVGSPSGPVATWWLLGLPGLAWCRRRPRLKPRDARPSEA